MVCLEKIQVHAVKAITEGKASLFIYHFLTQGYSKGFTENIKGIQI